MKIKKAIMGLMIGALSVMPLAASAKTYNVGSTPTGMPFTYLDS